MLGYYTLVFDHSMRKVLEIKFAITKNKLLRDKVFVIPEALLTSSRLRPSYTF